MMASNQNKHLSKGRRALLMAAVLLVAVGSRAGAQEHLRLSTTTSTDQSGLLKVVLPPFEQRFHLKVDVIAVGSGKALKLAENGDVDVVLSHAPELEEAFIKAGFGVNRRDVMHNDFIIVGPPDDPAQLRRRDDCRGGVQEARDGAGHVHLPRRRIRYASEGEGSLEGRGGHAERRVVRVGGSRHGRDFADGERAQGVHAL